MSNADIRGRFIWHELTTTSPDGAAEFYTKLVPWKTQPSALPSYSVWTSGSGRTGGLAELEEGGGSPQWLLYIGTADVDATVASALELGASVVTPATDVPDVGRFAVLEDPQGARFALFSPGGQEPAPAAVSGDAGEWSWHELATTDPEEAADFYVELFGWERGPSHDLGQMGTYQVIEHGGAEIGGIHRVRPGTAPRWLSYLRVADASRAASDARAAGARVLNGPVEVPDGGRIVMLEDPQGAVFAVYEPSAAVAAKTPKARKSARKPAEEVSAARRPESPTRVVAAEQPKPAVASELIVEEPTQPARAPAKPRRRASARKAPAKRVAPRRATGKKKAVRAKTHARPAAARKRPARAAAPARPARAAPARPGRRAPARPARTPARAAPARPARVAATRSPVRARPAPAKRVAAKKAVRSSRSRRR
jgi:predicted enzyme related to lactoylglutathione lyase